MKMGNCSNNVYQHATPPDNLKIGQKIKTAKFLLTKCPQRLARSAAQRVQSFSDSPRWPTDQLTRLRGELYGFVRSGIRQYCLPQQLLDAGYRQTFSASSSNKNDIDSSASDGIQSSGLS